MMRRLALTHLKIYSRSSSHSPALPEHPVACGMGGAGGLGPGEEDGWQRGSPARSMPATLTESTTTSRPPLCRHGGTTRAGSLPRGLRRGRARLGGGGLGWDLSFTSCPVWGEIIKNI